LQPLVELPYRTLVLLPEVLDGDGQGLIRRGLKLALDQLSNLTDGAHLFNFLG